MNRSITSYATLDGYMVKVARDKSIGIVKSNDLNGEICWIPRSLLQAGADLGFGDTDIVVEEWKAEQENLDY